MTTDELVQLLDRLKATMIAVATGGPRIGDVEGAFARDYDKAAIELERRRIQNPLPYRDLWDWYGRWSSGDMPSWQSRRQFVNGLFNDLLRTIQAQQENPLQERTVEPTGWSRVDRNVTEVRKRLETASTEEQFQAVALLCRETLISIAHKKCSILQSIQLGTVWRQAPAMRSVCWKPISQRSSQGTQTSTYVNTREPLTIFRPNYSIDGQPRFVTPLRARKQQRL